MSTANPPGYHTITAYLIVRDAVAALDFYRDALGAFEIMRFMGPDGRIMHAEMASATPASCWPMIARTNTARRPGPAGA
jgi:catechol 2,3-dioxygenase-like lactoylglutathione lyase family enzyme